MSNEIERGVRMRHRMSPMPWLVAGALLLIGVAPVAAHESIISSDPAAGARLAEPPTEVVLVFSGELDPPGSSFVVVDASGADVGSGEVDLDVADRNVLRGDVTITGDGAYDVRWTAVAADGHAEEGTLSFAVGPATSPDTAMTTLTPSTTLGLGLLGVAAALGLRRRSVGRSR